MTDSDRFSESMSTSNFLSKGKIVELRNLVSWGHLGFLCIGVDSDEISRLRSVVSIFWPLCAHLMEIRYQNYAFTCWRCSNLRVGTDFNDQRFVSEPFLLALPPTQWVLSHVTGPTWSLRRCWLRDTTCLLYKLPSARTVYRTREYLRSCI